VSAFARLYSGSSPTLFMTPPTVRADLTIDTASLHSLLRLALGRAPTEQALDWGALLARAEQERLASVIWQRSAESIRHNAPAAIGGAWQKRAIVSGLLVDQQLDALAMAIATLQMHGVSPVVLKGLPLAQRIYGDHTVRPVIDADLYIPAEERGAASKALASCSRCTPRHSTTACSITFSFRWSSSSLVSVASIFPRIVDDSYRLFSPRT
jgi:hypothetical protein